MPPSMKRQEPPKPQGSFPAGSILASAVPVTELREEFVKVCIYGRNRSGKTTLACHFPKPLLIVSSEPDTNGGAMSVSNLDQVSLVRLSPKRTGGGKVHGSARLVAIADELAATGHVFKTVVLDTITSMQDLILVELLGLPKVPEMMSWGMVPDGMYQQRAEKLRETVRPIIELGNCHVVILAQEKDHNPARDDDARGGRAKLMHTMQQGSFMAPALGATNAGWLQDACGYVIQIYEDEVMQEIVVPGISFDGKPAAATTQKVDTGKRQRHLRLLYHPNFAAGGRWQFNRDLPEFVTAATPRDLYKAMAQYIPSLKGT